MRRLAAWLFLGLLAGCAAGSDCMPSHGMALPIEWADNRPIVQATINGQPARLIFDTGASRTLLRQAAAQRLQLPAALTRSPWVVAVGGPTEVPMVAVSEMSVGPIQLSGLQLPTIDTVERPNLRAWSADGWLGIDFLGYGDIDLDFARQQATLYPAAACQSTKPLWEDGYTTLPGVRQASGKVAVTVMLDGTPVQAILDTGAEISAVSSATARKLGFDPGANTREVKVFGISGRPVAGHLHRFSTIRVGSDTFNNPTFTIVELPADVEMLIGMNFLRGRRVWISYPNGAVSIAPRPSRAASGQPTGIGP